MRPAVVFHALVAASAALLSQPASAQEPVCVELERTTIGPVYLPPPVGPVAYTTPYQKVCVL